MSSIDFLTNIVLDASPRVLEERSIALRQLVNTLHNHDVPFEYDERRFLHDNLYAACTLHAQKRIITLLEQAIIGTLSLGELRIEASALTGRLLCKPLALVDREEFASTLFGKPISSHPEAEASLTWLDQSGTRAFVDSSVSLVLLGRRITQDQCVRNHSDEFHLFTINVDVVLDNVVKTAEAIVHEAAHNALNLFLEDRKITLKDEPLLWYSPWTKSYRHHRGIVHGFFAFTQVALFYQRLQIPEFEIEIETYVRHQIKQLQMVYPALREILLDYPDELSELIELMYASTR